MDTSIFHIRTEARNRCNDCGRCMDAGCPCGNDQKHYRACLNRELSSTEIAEAVGDFHGSKFIKPHLSVYIDAIRRAGFDVVKK